MNGNTERAHWSASLKKWERKAVKRIKKFIKYLKSAIKKSCHLVPKVAIDLPFEGRKEG